MTTSAKPQINKYPVLKEMAGQVTRDDAVVILPLPHHAVADVDPLGRSDFFPPCGFHLQS